jgi:hypothetical protein
MAATPLRLIELGLLGAWAALLVTAFLFGRFNPERTRYARRPVLMGTSALLAILAWAIWLGAGDGTPASNSSLWIALGMTASFVGDLIMAGYIRLPRRVISGGVAFALAHGAYITAITGLAAASGLRLEPLAVAGVAAVTAGLWGAFVRAPGRGLMNTALLAYLLILSAMAGLALAAALAAPGLGTLAAGAMLFLASDVILLNQINRKNNWLLVSDVVWLLYIAGQALIVWSGRAGN